MNIRDGYLFQIPLRWQLSQWLSKLYSGLGFATQTEFDSAFVIRDGHVHSDEARLKGTLVSLRGEGDYYFDERLDLTVQVQLLQKGLVADAVRWVTSPVTKLLEFRLGGTIREPQWRPENLPKELFFIFD